MKKIYISFIAVLFVSMGLTAQNLTKGVVSTTGGSYGAVNNHVKLYSIPNNSNFVWLEDSILGDFSNHVIVDGHYAYMHVGRGAGHVLGGDRIFKYDLFDANAPIDSTDQLVGFKSFEISGDRLVITRGYPATSEFVKILDKNNLTSVLYSDNVIQGVCNGISIYESKAYIATTSFSDSGIVNVIDLGATIMNEGAYVLDSLSAGAQQIYVDNGNIYLTHARTSPNYSIWYAGVTSINMLDSTFTSDTTGFVNGTVYTAATGFDYFNGAILGNFGNPLELYNVVTAGKIHLITTYPSAAKKDPNGNMLTVQTTDYFSIGEITIYDEFGSVVNNYSTDISGSALAYVTNNVPTAVNDTVIHNLSSLPNLTPFPIDVLANDFDLDGDELTIDTVLSTNATIVANEIEYDPSSNGAAKDTIKYVMKDAWGDYDTAIVFIEFLVGISEITPNELSVFPNPVSDLLQILSESGMITNVKIMDVTGRTVKSSIYNNSQVSVDVSMLKHGIYFVLVDANSKLETHRIIVQ